jgi:PAS domain-containing protein
LGYSAEEVRHMSVLDVVDEADKPKAQSHVRRVFEEGAAQFETSLITKSRDKIACFFSGARILRDNQPCLLGAGIDITSLKRAEAELRSQTAFLEAQANSTIDGILVVDERGHVLLRNQRMLDIFKIPSAILADRADQPMLDYVTTLMKDPHSFLARVEYLYNHPSEAGRDEIELKRVFPSRFQRKSSFGPQQGY